MPNYFLAKTDPKTYSIADLQRDRQTKWDGVRNYQAVNVIKTWKPGDLVFVYHSQGQNKIVGLMEVVSLPEPDLNDPTQISWYAEVKYLKSYPEDQQVSLKEIKETGLFKDFALVKQSRLSTMACPENFVLWMQHKNLV
jgi:predicted RNA-binding protein with PUA-like domain